MRSIGIICIVAVFNAFSASAQVYEKSASEELSSEEISVREYEGQDQKYDIPENTYAIIGRNLRNSDGSEMGPYFISEEGKETFASTAAYPEKGIDNLKYAEDMETGDFPKGTEYNTCKLEAKGPEKNDKKG